MNTRIRELARQADDGYTGNNGDDMGHALVGEDAIEKFAELIVQECIEKITTYDLISGHSAKWEDIYDIHTRLLQDLGKELKQHFGVDE